MSCVKRARWFAWAFFLGPAIAGGQTRSEDPVPTARALIVVGLAGDPDHERAFQATALRWREWLTGPLGFRSDRVRVLSGRTPGTLTGNAPATRESIALEAESLLKDSRPGDRAWIFVLGHANHEDGHTFLHLPGPDLRDDEFGPLFRGLAAREQVFWLTMPGSGSFLPALSRSGRIVVAATEAEGEVNETEFPEALADVSKMPVEKLDLDKDRRISIRELFDATVSAVNARFAADQRIATEHAQLADDGMLASKTFLPTRNDYEPK